MRRNLAELTDTSYDLIVVGGGIYGACVARDAALRGLTVALLERGDFGNATSHNSLKLIHGGLRYLQHLDFSRVRESLQERRFWLRAAPHLVRPLKFVIPTYGHGTRGPEALWCGLRAQEAIGIGRNQGMLVEQRIPRGRVLSRRDLLELIPGLAGHEISGGAVWFDGQMESPDRVLIEVLEDAVGAGARIANYVEVRSFLERGDCITGVGARDVLSGSDLVVQGKLTINASGPWVAGLLSTLGRGDPADLPGLFKGLNLVTRSFSRDYAFGFRSALPSDAVLGSGRRLYFVTPWGGRAVVGTSHHPYGDGPDSCRFDDRDIEAFLAEINAAYPSARLTRDDVYYCYGGLDARGGARRRSDPTLEVH